MTVKIEREAVLRVINNNNGASLEPPCYQPLRDDDCSSGVTPIHQSKGLDIDDYNHSAGCTSRLHRETPELDETDDDSTVSSCSTAKGVTFATPLVTEVRLRIRTKKIFLRDYYYTTEETQRFRQEYREERRLRAQEADSETSSSVLTLGETGSEKSTRDGLSGQNIDTTKSHRISRVVILHQNKLETFTDKEMGAIQPTTVTTDASTCTTSNRPLPGKCERTSKDFFDCDNFWNGQITWY